MLYLRRIAGFSKIKLYLERFQTLEKNVNILERQYVAKKEEIQKIKDLNSREDQEKLQKLLAYFSNSQYESQSVKHQKQKLRELQKKRQVLMQEGASRVKISSKLTLEEKSIREKKFVLDLAKFSLKYSQIVANNKFDDEVRSGLGFSVKALESILEKEGVQWIGKVDQKFDPEIHEKIDGSGETVKAVRQYGLRVKGTLISKSKVHL